MDIETDQIMFHGFIRSDGLKHDIGWIKVGSLVFLYLLVMGLGNYVLGDPVDGHGPVYAASRLPIHRAAPTFIDLDTNLAIFETGIKVVDSLAPYKRGGKIGLLAVQELVNCFHYEIDNNIAKVHSGIRLAVLAKEHVKEMTYM